MDEWMHKWADDGWIHVDDGWMEGWMDEWIDGWMDGWMNGCIDGQMMDG